MSGDEIHIAQPEPAVSLRRIDKIPTLEIQEADLERLESLVAGEAQALGFTTFMAGVFITAVLAFVAAKGLSPVAVAVHVAVMGFSLVLSCWFGASWRRCKKERPKLLQHIRGQSSSLAPGAEPRLLPGGKP